MSKQTPKQQSLCNNKFDGLMNAAPHKRYKSFAATVADWESVWLDCDPNQPLPEEGVISVWPEEMFAAAVCTDKPFFKMDVHEFCDLLEAYPDATIRVFPNGKNWTDTAAEDLLEDMLEELDRVEGGYFPADSRDSAATGACSSRTWKGTSWRPTSCAWRNPTRRTAGSPCRRKTGRRAGICRSAGSLRRRCRKE